jgi:DNA-binding winged helix-turn-helix (wHTH) protein
LFATDRFSTIAVNPALRKHSGSPQGLSGGTGMTRNRFYNFGPFRLDAARRVLLQGREIVPLMPRVLDLLIVLVENAGSVVSKEELIKAVWQETFVEEGNLTQNISLLRKALGSDPAGPMYVETIPKRGYRFLAPVRVEDETTGDQVETSVPAPRHRDIGAAEGSDSGGHTHPAGGGRRRNLPGRNKVA